MDDGPSRRNIDRSTPTLYLFNYYLLLILPVNTLVDAMPERRSHTSFGIPLFHTRNGSWTLANVPREEPEAMRCLVRGQSTSQGGVQVSSHTTALSGLFRQIGK